MADYNSNYTGQEIDEAVEKTLSEVPEYWIPLVYNSGVISVPADKEAEVTRALFNPGSFNILGCKFSGGADIAGHRIYEGVFSCPLTAGTASEFGVSGPASIIVYDNGGSVTVEVVPDIFIVTLTPTAQDYSGVMDKTVAEINAAYEAGREIVFRLYSSPTEYMEMDVASRGFASNAYPSFNAYTVTNHPIDALVNVWTGTTDDGTQSTYATTIYPLTPMS